MKTTLKDLLETGIFDQYTIVAGQNYLDKAIHSLSILETPDFENYIIENSVILSTFYPIKSDSNTFHRLLKTLSDRKTAGIIIKIHRYIEQIPTEIIDRANTLKIPIITLDYDANLSTLFNSILSEMHTKDYQEQATNVDYATLLNQVYENPTTETIMQIIQTVPELDLLIHNLLTKKTYTSDQFLMRYFNQHKQSTNIFHKLGHQFYYIEDVIYDGNPIYRFILSTTEEKRHILHNYVEIIKLLIVIIYQKKIENTLKQHQFLINFISNPYIDYSNEKLIELSKRYSWNIHFPIILIIMTLKKDKKSIITTIHTEFIRKLILDYLQIESDELRMTVFNDQLLLIVNAANLKNIAGIMNDLHKLLQLNFKHTTINFTYSNFIYETSEMSKAYTLLSEALMHVENKSLLVNVFNEDSMRLLTLLKNIDYQALKDYVHLTLKPMIEYEKNHNTPLIQTIFAYIENQFNANITAQKLFVHYNTIKYRLDLLKTLNIGIDSTDSGFFELYFALYLYINFEQETRG